MQIVAGPADFHFSQEQLSLLVVPAGGVLARRDGGVLYLQEVYWLARREGEGCREAMAEHFSRPAPELT